VDASKAPASLKLGLLRDLTAPHPVMTIPAGSFSKEKVTLTGKSSITRFIARQFTRNGLSLYDTRTLEQQAQIDDWIDLQRSSITTPSAITNILNKAAAPEKNNLSKDGKNLSLADLVAWDVVRRNKGKNPKADAWSTTVEKAAPELLKAAAEVDQVISTAHLLDELRYPIVEQLSQITGVPVTTIFPMLENKFPKDPEGDFSIAIPRLRLPGNPSEVAKDIQQKVGVVHIAALLCYGRETILGGFFFFFFFFLFCIYLIDFP
jgi:hypothetical protein